MKPRTTIGRAKAPDGTELELIEHDGQHELRVGQVGLMESRRHHSEEELARLACEGLGPNAIVMVGGLGMGFTLRAALDVLTPDARVVQVELVPEVVEWNRGPLGPHADHPLQDPRVELVIGDFRKQVQNHRYRGSFDALLVDIDNGSRALVHRSNAWTYSRPGLTAMRGALKPGGRIALWSARDDTRIAQELHEHDLEVERFTVHSRPGRRGPKNFVIIGRRPA